MVFNLFTYWLANMAALPGLRLGPAAVVTQTTTSVANTIPAGGAVAVGLTYTILTSWGFNAQVITLYIGVTGVWNTLMKLALPVVSLALLAVTGQAAPALVVAALIGLVLLLVAVSLFSLALWKKEFARRIGDFDVGHTGRVRQAIKATEDASPPMASGRSAQTVSAGAPAGGDRLTQIGAL